MSILDLSLFFSFYLQCKVFIHSVDALSDDINRKRKDKLLNQKSFD